MDEKKKKNLESQDDEAYLTGKKPKEKPIETPGPQRKTEPFQVEEEEISSKEPKEKPEKPIEIKEEKKDGKR